MILSIHYKLPYIFVKALQFIGLISFIVSYYRLSLYHNENAENLNTSVLTIGKTNLFKQKQCQILNLAPNCIREHVVFVLYDFELKPPVIWELCANLLTINSDICLSLLKDDWCALSNTITIDPRTTFMFSEHYKTTST
jgi:hypothetical protein